MLLWIAFLRSPSRRTVLLGTGRALGSFWAVCMPKTWGTLSLPAEAHHCGIPRPVPGSPGGRGVPNWGVLASKLPLHRGLQKWGGVLMPSWLSEPPGGNCCFQSHTGLGRAHDLDLANQSPVIKGAMWPKVSQSESIPALYMSFFLQELPSCRDVSVELSWAVFALLEVGVANPEEIRGRQRREPAGPETSIPLELWIS